jgi:SPP1 family predicted phage head-tail adaptor
MQSGKLRHKVLIESAAEAQDSFGEPDPTWSTFGTAWAAIAPLTGREAVTAQQIDAQIDHKVTIRYLAGVAPKMRVKFGSRIFNIISVANIDERNREIQLLVTESV